MRRALGVLLAAAALAATPPSQAAASPPLVVTDPVGDAIDRRASMDIKELRFEVKPIRPGGGPALWVTMKLAAAPEQQLVAYVIVADVDECGQFEMAYRPGTVYERATGFSSTQFFMCDPDDDTGAQLVFARSNVSKDSITWVMAIDSMPKAVRAKKQLTKIHAFTQLAEPALGILGNGDLDVAETPLPTDAASTPKPYSFG